ncbi:MAG: hypothetical protein WED10_09515 [Brumimicrobium sp.]
MKSIILLLAASLVVFSCKKDEPEDPENNTGEDQPQLIFKVKLDPNQERLNNFGQPETVPAGHGAQTPVFNEISAHYIELAPNAFTQLGAGEIVYHAPETDAGGDDAVDFEKASVVGHDEVFYSINLSQVGPGTYEWARVSLTYQNYDVDFRASGYDMTGTVSSFVGYNTYLKAHKINEETVQIYDNKLQGYWAWETHPNQVLQNPIVNEGQSPVTTVPNPLNSTSPIPAGSCVVTGEFPESLTITGNETEDIIVDLSFSINNSFEWDDDLDNNIYEPMDGDIVVDMGIRGLIPIVVQ